MIGKAEWFQRRKYGGWGLAPKTWQGWVYIALMILPIIAFQSLPFWSNTMRVFVTFGWLLLVFLDTTHMMFNLRKDEMEYKIEAVSERNAAYAMIAVIIAGIVYQIIRSGLAQEFMLDWFLVAALFAGMIAKAVSNLVLERRGV